MERITGQEPAAVKVNYFKGNDKSKWKNNIHTYNMVSLGELYKGINLNLHAYGNNVEKLFVVEPGAEPKQILLSMEGAEGLSIDESGKMIVATALGQVAFTKPVAYQEIDGRKKYVDASYALTKFRNHKSRIENGYRFTIGQYDPDYELIIDPLLASTFLGNTSTYGGGISSIALDSSNNVYVTGSTASADFPTAGNPYDSTYSNNVMYVSSRDVFVSKLDSNLSTLIASTFLGGGKSQGSSAIVLDSSNNVYVVGGTSSADFPTVGSPHDDSYNGNYDVFVSKLDSSLSTLVASTLLGGSWVEYGRAITLDSSNNVYVTGNTSSADFPTVGSPHGDSLNGNIDVFVSKLDSSLSTLIASTFLGGEEREYGRAIALDSSNNVYVTGNTSSADFPTADSPYEGSYNWDDVFVSKLSSGLSALIASTFLGGSRYDSGRAIALDSNNNVYVTGFTDSADFPTAGIPYDDSYNWSRDVFVSKLNCSLSTLIASTFLGGGGNDEGYAIALDSSNNVYVTGETWLTDFPTSGSQYDDYFNGTRDVFVSKLLSNLNTLTASTFLGGTNADGGTAIALDSSNNVYVAGYTSSADFPTAGSPYDDSYNGPWAFSDVFVSKLELVQSAEAMIIGDIDGSGSADVILDYGRLGTYVRLSDSTLSQLHKLSPETMATGNFDGGTKDDILLDYVSLGTWIRMNNSSWTQLHTLSLESMIIGDIDGGGDDDAVIDFGAPYGIWVRMNNSFWAQLHSLSPEAMITGDIDGSGKDDVILDFGGLGTWIRMNNSSWVQLHSLSPEAMTTGDIDGGGKDDIILDFGPGYGIWARMNNSSWAQLHTLSPETIITGDIDGGGLEDIILDFGDLGTWIRMNNSTWTQLHTLSPEAMTTGYIDGGGSADVILDFGDLGIWARMNNSSWLELPKP